jgi:restriction system protein
MKKKQAEFIKWMPATLNALRKLGGSGTPQEVSEQIAENLKLPNSKITELTKSGIPRFHNQVCWARQYLLWEGYLESSKRGIWQLSANGLNKKLTEIESREIFLKWVDIFVKKRKTKTRENEKESDQQETEVTDDNASESKNYKTDLIEILRNLTPRGFEELCLLLLRENGFENLKLTPKSHDGGIDGISTLRVNPFVSFRVLFQCKRYNGRSSISRAQIGEFRNAMQGRADKGIFITTSYFSPDAEKEATRDGATPVELVDAEKLVDMFEKTELGLKPVTTYEIDRVFFSKFMNN